MKTLSPGPFDAQLPNMEVRVLTWKLPYAELMLPPMNKLETRTYSTKYRGWVLLHVAQKPFTSEDVLSLSSLAGWERIYSVLEENGKYPYQDVEGCCIAIGWLKDVRPMKPEDAHQAFVNYEPNRFVWEFNDWHNIRPFEHEGRLGLTKFKTTYQIEII